eukprot:749416-Prorocentrum_minimum.AAC.1
MTASWIDSASASASWTNHGSPSGGATPPARRGSNVSLAVSLHDDHDHDHDSGSDWGEWETLQTADQGAAGTSTSAAQPYSGPVPVPAQRGGEA